MTLVSTQSIVEDARVALKGAAAFNVITLEYAEAIVAGAEAVGLPVILQISQNAIGYHGGQVRPLTAACAEVARAASVPVSLHLDHVEDIGLLHQAADVGFSSAMYDAGSLPHADNVAATRDAADWARGAGVWLEAELGYVGGKPDAPASAHAVGVRTDPAEAAAYVEETGVQALAVAVGSSHAMTTRTASLDLDLIDRLRAAVPVPLVLHGSSGVPDDLLTAAIRAGIVKVNIGTALNIAFTGAVREGLADTALVDSRRYLGPGRDAIARTARHLLQVVAGVA